MGQTHAELLRNREPNRLLRHIAIALSKTLYCAISATVSVAHPASRNTALLRGSLHTGAIAGLMGWRTLALYADATIHRSNGGHAK